MDHHKDTRTNGKTNKHAYEHRKSSVKTVRMTDRQTNRHTDRHTDRQTDRQTERQTDRHRQKEGRRKVQRKRHRLFRASGRRQKASEVIAIIKTRSTHTTQTTPLHSINIEICRRPTRYSNRKKRRKSQKK